MTSNIVAMLEMVTNWENEIPWEKKPWYLRQICEVITESFISKKPFNDSHSYLEHKPLKIPPFQYGYAVDDPFWNIIDNVVKDISIRLQPYCSAILLHGSIADRQVTQGWSDLDCIIFVKTNVLGNAELLVSAVQEIRKFKSHFKAIDRHSHHAFKVLTETELNSVTTDILPYETLKKARSLLEEPLVIQVANTRNPPSLRNQASFLSSTLASGRMTHHERNSIPMYLPLRYNVNQMYQFKYFVGRILLLPAIIAANNGIYLDKRTSFDFIQEYHVLANHIKFFELIRSEVDWKKRLSSPERDFIPVSIKSDDFIRHVAGILQEIG